MSSINVVIPIHELNGDSDKELLKKAVESVKNNTKQPDFITLVVTKDISEYGIEDLIKENGLTVLKNDTDKTDFQNQINLFAKQSKEDYFLILEFDDELSKKSIENYVKYIDFYGDKATILLPITADVDNENNFLKFTNADILSQSVYGEDGDNGVLTSKVLKNHTSFNTSGGLFKTDEFVSIGGFKNSLNIAFIYEYLLRATNNDQNVIVVPKLGCLHRNNRVGSFLHSLNERNITKEEVSFYFESAKKEFYFIKERNLIYNV